MSNSKLVTDKVPASTSNYTKGRSGVKISKITIHHMAGSLTAAQCGSIFKTAGRGASSNYGIGRDCSVGLYVDEADRSWASSNGDNDRAAVTIEVANSSTGGNWPVSDKVLAKLIDLCVDICQRNGIKKLNYTGDSKGNLTRHNMFAATACPGKYLQSKFEYIANEVNKKLDKKEPTPTPSPTPAPSTSKKVGDKVTINGIYIASTSTQKLKPAKTSGTITKIVKGARNPYLLDNGMGWVNDSVITSGGSTSSASTSTSTSSTIKVKDKVKIKSSATKYATGQTIPSSIKARTHTVQQLSTKKDKALLKEIVSWVYTKDISKV